jgi:hypothetical protein
MEYLKSRNKEKVLKVLDNKKRSPEPSGVGQLHRCLESGGHFPRKWRRIS